jgi:hypothetical protein
VRVRVFRVAASLVLKVGLLALPPALEQAVRVRKVVDVRPDKGERFDHRVMQIGVYQGRSDDHLKTSE